MSGLTSRNKGKAGEREIVAIMQPVVDYAYQEAGIIPVPRLQRNSLQSDGGGSDLHGLTWLAIEIKRGEQPQFGAWWLQTLRQATLGQVPVLAYRPNSVPWRFRLVGGIGPGFKLGCVVDIDCDAFEEWLYQSLRVRLTGG